MLSEHLIYSTAFAILTYTVYRREECLYIIIGSAYIPDIDLIADRILKKMSITVLIYGKHIKHGDFHNVLAMILYAILIALLLNTIGIEMKNSFILAIIGFGLHLFEDALVSNHGYKFFWPISDKTYSIGLIENYNGNVDFYGIANTKVLIVGIMFTILSIYMTYI